MSRKHTNFKEQGILRRKENVRAQKISVLIACEGEKTETLYLQSMFDYAMRERKIANESYLKIAPHEHTDPTGVLEDLLAEEKRISKKYKKSDSEPSEFEERWIVIDRDPIDGLTGGGHPEKNFENAIKSSSEQNIDVAWSNPCFELWFFLHFDYLENDIDRHELQKKTLQKFKDVGILNSKAKVDDMKNNPNIFEGLKEKYPKAKKFAGKLCEQHKADFSAPCTTVHKLAEILLGENEECKHEYGNGR